MRSARVYLQSQICHSLNRISKI